jgi:tetratricopeptide (TPR) repeat protein
VRGTDGAYVFSFQDMVLLRSARDLLAADVSARKVRSALEKLRRQLPSGRPLSAVHISALGDRVLVRDEQRVWEPDSGQMLLDLAATPPETPASPSISRPAPAGGRPDAPHEPRQDPIGSADEWYDTALDLEASDPARAMAAYANALALDPDHADAHLNLGRLLHEAHDLEGAETHYRAAVEAEPEDGRAHFNLGVLAEDRRRVDDAIVAYREALRLDERLAPAHFNLSRLHEARGAEGEALVHLLAYKRLISALPTSLP